MFKSNQTSFSFFGALAIVLGFALSSVPAFADSSALPELRVVPHVELSRYLGTWYEIARYSNSFQKNCYATTAEYSLKSDGNIKVVNRCRKGSVDGELEVATGRARVTDRVTNAKLKVSFFWPFSGKYWIIDLGKDYEYAVVGEPSRKYLWVLSRTPQLDPVLFDEILGRLVEQGYDPAQLLMTEHLN